METRRPLIVDVRRGSLEDGPGIRTVVFFKGCPLRCVFCHNPEAQEPGPELAFAAERCLHCGACAGVCRPAAIDLSSLSRIDRGRCDLCGRCAEVCTAGALRLIGRYWPVESLVDRLFRDAVFYRHSGGGVTFSGGECTMFPDYLEAVLRRLAGRGVHVALETSGFFDYGVFAAKILPYVQLVMFDVKLADSAASRRHLGQPNERIVENLGRLLGESGVEVLPRVPLIPGVTDSRENLEAIVELLRRLGAATLAPLPYNPLGSG
ncbi:MAG: glycyl-radical enzyme activating protein, partial [Acidobacteria bacterium]|nr:glycyl-radical enzyme activating protein [Acidobacteriota bacterium]